MANHVIRVDPLNPFSILQAESQINSILRGTDKKVDEFIKEIGEIGRMAAQGAYGSGVSVTLDSINNGVAINAHGRAVVFLEFGAGSTTDSTDRYAGEMPFPVYRGSFSDVVNGPYKATGYRYWTFGGKPITHVNPRNGMQKAYEAIMQDIESVAKRVFG